MLNFYNPPTTPYMTDAMYVSLGGLTGTSTALQRNYAYRMAEGQVSQEIGTYITPTTVTGSYPHVAPNVLLDLGIGKINSVDSVVLHERWTNGVERFISGTPYIYDVDNGYIAIQISPNDNSSCVGCTGYAENIYKAEIAFTAGYSTGVIVGNPDIELALKMATDLVLRMMDDEGIGQEAWTAFTTIQIGRFIQTVNNKYLKNTSFGISHKAQFISNILKPYKITKAGKLGR